MNEAGSFQSLRDGQVGFNIIRLVVVLLKDLPICGRRRRAHASVLPSEALTL